jgi:hypothetical protein
MRQLNVHYERGLPGPALEGLPDHRRRVVHRPQLAPEGETITGDQARQERSLLAVEDQATFALIYRNASQSRC